MGRARLPFLVGSRTSCEQLGLLRSRSTSQDSSLLAFPRQQSHYIAFYGRFNGISRRISSETELLNAAWSWKHGRGMGGCKFVGVGAPQDAWVMVHACIAQSIAPGCRQVESCWSRTERLQPQWLAGLTACHCMWCRNILDPA